MSTSSFAAEPSVGLLRTEAEVNRARLTGTVEDLRTQVAETATDLKDRLSPASIKAEVSDYVRDSRDQLWHRLQDKARDNPLQAVAVAAAIAYPAFALLRAMPAPLLLIGSGLLLSSKQSAASELSSAARETAQSAMDGAGAAVDKATDTARQTLHDVQDVARNSVDTVMARASTVASSIKDQVLGAADETKATLSETADKISSQAQDVAKQARETVSATWDQNPLLVAGVGLAIGAFIAAAFPSTKTEESLFGDSSDALRRQADGVAAKAVEAAKGVVDGTTAAATAAGLSVDGLRKVGGELTDKVRAVAERGIEAALGETNSARNQPFKERAES